MRTRTYERAYEEGRRSRDDEVERLSNQLFNVEQAGRLALREKDVEIERLRTRVARLEGPGASVEL